MIKITDEIRTNLVILATQKGLTLKDAIAQAGLSTYVYNTITGKNGKTSIYPTTLTVLCNFFDVAPSAIVSTDVPFSRPTNNMTGTSIKVEGKNLGKNIRYLIKKKFPLGTSVPEIIRQLRMPVSPNGLQHVIKEDYKTVKSSLLESIAQGFGYLPEDLLNDDIEENDNKAHISTFISQKPEEEATPEEKKPDTTNTAEKSKTMERPGTFFITLPRRDILASNVQFLADELGLTVPQYARANNLDATQLCKIRDQRFHAVKGMLLDNLSRISGYPVSDLIGTDIKHGRHHGEEIIAEETEETIEEPKETTTEPATETATPTAKPSEEDTTEKTDDPFLPAKPVKAIGGLEEYIQRLYDTLTYAVDYINCGGDDEEAKTINRAYRLLKAESNRRGIQFQSTL